MTYKARFASGFFRLSKSYQPNTLTLFMSNSIPWSLEQDSLLISLCAAGKHRFEDMLSLFPGKSKYQLIHRARHLHICNTYIKPPKYTYNKAYFDEMTPESAYWAGILQTDGCLSKRRDYITIIWGASVKDKAHMEHFLRCINSTHPILTQEKKCQLSTKDPNKTHTHCRVVFEGAFQWADSLKRHYGFDHNKTLRTAPPNLPSIQHKLAYIKGLIDGDGTITHTKKDLDNGGLCINLCGCNRELLMWVSDTIDCLDIPENYRRRRHVNQASDEACFYWGISGLKASIFHELMMRVPTPYLARKWESISALTNKRFWQNRPDLWPSDQFFNNILSPSP